MRLACGGFHLCQGDNGSRCLVFQAHKKRLQLLFSPSRHIPFFKCACLCMPRTGVSRADQTAPRCRPLCFHALRAAPMQGWHGIDLVPYRDALLACFSSPLFLLLQLSICEFLRGYKASHVPLSSIDRQMLEQNGRQRDGNPFEHLFCKGSRFRLSCRPIRIR